MELFVIIKSPPSIVTIMFSIGTVIKKVKSSEFLTLNTKITKVMKKLIIDQVSS